MAIAVPPPAMNVLIPWPLFTAYDTDGYPLIGGRLWSFEANTTTPKATYADPYGLSANTNPVILDAMGQAVVWLDGFYHLRLENADGVQLWEVLSYEYPAITEPPAEGMVTGFTDTTVTSVDGAGVLQATNAVPLGYRVKSVLIRIETEFGASHGLSSIMVGDAWLCDGWGTIGRTVGLSTGQRDMLRGDQPIAATAYTVLLSAIGGNFDSAGSCTIRAFWESITGWS